MKFAREYIFGAERASGGKDDVILIWPSLPPCLPHRPSPFPSPNSLHPSFPHRPQKCFDFPLPPPSFALQFNTKMPPPPSFPPALEHVLVSTQIRCETGPTIVGDSDSDVQLMGQLGARKVYRIGNTFAEYMTEWTPRRVLDRLSQLGFRVISMTGAGQTVIWTMAREIAKAKETNGICCENYGQMAKNEKEEEEMRQKENMEDVD